MDGRSSIARIARVMREFDADIVALQEVVSHEHVDAERNQAKYLADVFGFEFAIGETRRHEGGAYGNVTLSRWPIETSHAIDVSVPGREPRGILRTDIVQGERRLHVFNVHLGTSFQERRIQAEKLAGEKPLRDPDLCGPRVVLGDFNEWVHGQITRALRGEFRERDSHRFFRWGYPGLLPLLSLDHFYCDNHLNMIKLVLHRSKLSLLASDHLPLVVDLQWE